MTSEKKASDFIKNVMGFQKRSKTLHTKLQLLLDDHAAEERQKSVVNITRYWNEADCFADYQGCKDAILNGYGENNGP